MNVHFIQHETFEAPSAYLDSPPFGTYSASLSCIR